MYKFGENHPVLFEIILIVVSFAAAAVFTIAGNMINLHPDLATVVGRIAVSLVLMVIYKRAFKGNRFFVNLFYVLPALLFAVWNIFYFMSSGIALGGVNFFVEGAILAIAPALFEEVLFRWIFIYNLKKNGSSDKACLFISSILFAAIHMTNIVGMSPAGVALQTGYSFVIGLVFAAIYLRNGSLLQIAAAHFMIDFTNHIFVEQPTSASGLHLTIMGLLLAVETVYAVMLTVGRPAAGK